MTKLKDIILTKLLIIYLKGALFLQKTDDKVVTLLQNAYLCTIQSLSIT